MTVAAIRASGSLLRSVSEKVEASGNRLRDLWARDVMLRDGNEHEAGKLLSEMDEVIPGLEMYAARLASIARPADSREIAEHLIAVRLNFHNSKATGEGYARIMTERVEAKAPSFAGLEWACRKIIDTHKFMPVTAEVLEALAAAESQVNTLRDLVRTMPARRARVAQIASEAVR